MFMENNMENMNVNENNMIKPLYETETDLTLKAYKKMAMAYNGELYYITIRILLFVAIVLMYMVHAGKTLKALIGGLCCATVIFCVYLLLEKLKCDTAYNNLIQINNGSSRIKYYFYGDCLRSESFSIRYEDLHNIVEDKNNYYIFAENNIVFLICKGNCDENLLMHIDTLKKNVKFNKRSDYYGK